MVRGPVFFLFHPTNLLVAGSETPKSGEGRQVDDGGRKDPAVDTKPTRDEVHDNLEEEDGPWYLGKAKEEFHRRRGQPIPKQREEEDPIQVCVSEELVWSIFFDECRA